MQGSEGGAEGGALGGGVHGEGGEEEGGHPPHPGHLQAPVAQGSLSKKLTFPHRCGDEHISECVVMTTCVWSGPHVCGDHNTHVVMTTHMPDGTYVDITPPVWTSTNIILP